VVQVEAHVGEGWASWAKERRCFRCASDGGFRRDCRRTSQERKPGYNVSDRGKEMWKPGLEFTRHAGVSGNQHPCRQIR